MKRTREQSRKLTEVKKKRVNLGRHRVAVLRTVRKLSRRQSLFIAEYLLDLNGTQAAIRAGYSEKTAQEQASGLLSNVMVQREVQKRTEKRAARLELRAEEVIETIRETVARCKGPEF